MWPAFAGRSVTDKVLAVIFSITAFVVIGLEHSVANMFFLPYGMVLDGFSDSALISGSVTNLFAVTAGNIAGGSLLVAGFTGWLTFATNSGNNDVCSGPKALGRLGEMRRPLLPGFSALLDIQSKSSAIPGQSR